MNATNPDLESYIRAGLALILVIGLIFASAWIARRFNLGGAVPLGKRRKRLAIAEILAVDSRRRLVLVRRDATEHLLLIGGAGGDLVVETGIKDGTMVPDGETAS